MANPEHLRILMEGVESWNKHVDSHSSTDYGVFKADFSNWDGAFLREFNLTRLIEQSRPYSVEIRNFVDDYRAGELSMEVQREGWKLLDNINLEFANLSGIDLNHISIRHANLGGSDLSFSNLKSACLHHSSLSKANLTKANLDSASLVKTTLNKANLTGASLIAADLSGADLSSANLSGANLDFANLRGANLTKTILSEASLCNANLQEAIFVETNLEGANLTGSKVYGISTWNLQLSNSIQTDLIISSDEEATITLDNLEVAQLLYLLLKNEKVRHVIDTLTSKVVLILGRFTEERKMILDMLRDELRQRNYLPILFDFEKPTSRDLTETISTIAHMSRFIIADLTDAKSIPQELLQIVPDLPSVPVQPILLASQREYAMFEHFRRYPWVLNTYLYNSSLELLNDLLIRVIEPAESKVLEMKPSK